MFRSKEIRIIFALEVGDVFSPVAKLKVRNVIVNTYASLKMANESSVQRCQNQQVLKKTSLNSLE